MSYSHFLNKFSVNRRILTCKEIQPYSSTLCGIYCVFFILYRSIHTFTNCTRFFSNVLKKNDKILLNFFNKFQMTQHYVSVQIPSDPGDNLCQKIYELIDEFCLWIFFVLISIIYFFIFCAIFFYLCIILTEHNCF